MKSKILSLFILLAWCGIALHAEDDPVLMRVNGKEVLRSEFEYLFNKNAAAGARTDAGEVERYVGLFVDLKLKVAAAEAAGLDTLPQFRDELEANRRSLSIAYLTDTAFLSRKARRYYDRLAADTSVRRVRAAHIFKRLPQNVSPSALRAAEATMDSLYRCIQSGGPDAFEACLSACSDEPEAFWYEPLQSVSELEDTLFTLSPGTVSKPFYSPLGLHIAKVYERRSLPPFEEMKRGIIRSHPQWLREAGDTLAARLLPAYGYSLREDAYKELMTKGKTSRTLFTLAGREYTGDDFARFLGGRNTGLRRAFGQYVTRTVLFLEQGLLEEKYPDFRRLMQEVRDGMLLYEITDCEVWQRGSSDEAGLQAYFDTHRQRYCWEEPRYQGIVLHAKSRRQAHRIRKFLKKLPEDEWLDAIRLAVNAPGEQRVQVEQGTFSRGENPYVDHLFFDGKKPAAPEGFPATVFLGRKLDGPSSYHEVPRSVLAADYQAWLEQEWLARLRKEGKVEVNQEVLKTVNNHGGIR